MLQKKKKKKRYLYYINTSIDVCEHSFLLRYQKYFDRQTTRISLESLQQYQNGQRSIRLAVISAIVLQLRATNRDTVLFDHGFVLSNDLRCIDYGYQIHTDPSRLGTDPFVSFVITRVAHVVCY